MAEKKLQPIIIKRVKKGGHAAHGGAWKIAYADFMTAMMAFFLVMWLLGSTTEGDRKGIADYFSSPLKLSMSGGSGAGNSSSIIPGGGNDLARVHGQVRRADAKADKDPTHNVDTPYLGRGRDDTARIKALQKRLDAAITANPRLNEYRSQIRIDLTPDGLQVQIVDAQNRPMFDSGSAVVKPYMRDILHAIGAALADVDTSISLAGHTDATPYAGGERGYSNWELSADRANAARRELIAAGMPESKLARVVGLAASDPLEPSDPRAPINRRITITVLTREAEERLLNKKPVIVPAAELAAQKSENPASAAQP